MKKLLQNPIGFMAALVMVATMLIVPQTALARVMISDGTSPGGPGGGPGGGNESETDLLVELGAKIRVFLAPNVALSSSLGLGVRADDANDTAVIAHVFINCHHHYHRV